MRTLIVFAFTLSMFISGTPAAHAQVCPTGCSIGSTSGQCVDSGGEPCSATGTAGSFGTPGATVPGSFGQPSSNSGTNVTLINPLNSGTSLESFLNSILAFVIRIGAIVVVLMLVYVGYLFVVARGEPAKITEARSALLWTVVGALILLGAQAIAIGITATVQALSVGQ